MTHASAVFTATTRQAAATGLEVRARRTRYDIDRFSNLRPALADATADCNLAREFALLPDLEIE